MMHLSTAMALRLPTKTAPPFPPLPEFGKCRKQGVSHRDCVEGERGGEEREGLNKKMEIKAPIYRV
jgi:hypothetical protein